jgi:hypothetical protein
MNGDDMRRLMLALVAVFVASVVTVNLCHADPIIYDNNVWSVDNGRVNDPDFPVFLMAADNFSISTGVQVTDINWLGSYKDIAPGRSIPSDDFSIFVFAFNSGIPSVNPLYDIHLGTVQRNMTSQIIGYGLPVYSYSAVLPNLQLQSGNYLLAIWNGPSGNGMWPGDGMWVWDSLDYGSTPGDFYSKILSPTNQWQEYVGYGVPEFAFSLTGNPVPEPATGLMAAAGLLAIAFVRFRNKRLERKGREGDIGSADTRSGKNQPSSF